MQEAAGPIERRSAREKRFRRQVETIMAQMLVLLFVLLLVVAAAVHLLEKYSVGGWLLAAPAAMLCVGLAMDLAQGPARIGVAAYQSDMRQMEFCLLVLVLGVVAALRPQWRWLFWVAWVLNVLICAALVYLAFFWKVFS